MKWITRERPKIDRIACPWLILRFIDPQAEFLYIPPHQVLEISQETGAIPYDVPDVELGHQGELCSFDAFLKKYAPQYPQMNTQALQKLATIVRAADTNQLELSPQAAGLLAISQGLSKIFQNDHDMLNHALLIYDALYVWCQKNF